MPNPGFWTGYLILGIATWGLCSALLTRWPIMGKEAVGIIVVWPPFLALALWVGLCEIWNDR
jgi:hypothetical protein